MRAPAIATVLAIMVLQTSAYAGESKASESQRPADAAQAESAPASAGSSARGAQNEAEPSQATPTQTAAPIPPPPATSPPAPQGPPPGYGYPYSDPPPGYPYPPPGYGPGYYAPPPGYPYGYRASPYPRDEAPLPDEERQHGTIRRIYMFSLGFGMGALSGGFSKEGRSFRLTEPGFSYTLRFAAAASESWLVLLALDGTWVDFSDGRLSGSSSRSSTTFTIGTQYFMKPWLYSRLGVGLGCMEWRGDYDSDSNCKGMAASGGVGIEFSQQGTTSIAAELAGTVVRYTSYVQGEDDVNRIWFSVGGNVVFSFF